MTFGLPDGIYSAKLSAYSRYSFTYPEVLTVSGTTTVTYYGTPASISDPSLPELCIIFGWLITGAGQAFQGAVVVATITNRREFSDQGHGVIHSDTLVVSDADGFFEMELLKNEQYKLFITAQNYEKVVTIPNALNINYKDL